MRSAERDATTCPVDNREARPLGRVSQNMIIFLFWDTLERPTIPISDMDQNIKMAHDFTGAHASVSSASERYNMKLWIDLVLTHPIRGSSTVEWRRRVRGGAGAPGFGPGAFPMAGSADRGGH